MIVGLLIAALTGCAPVPAKIQLEGDTNLTSYEAKDVALPTAKVLDAKGKAIEPAPKVVWSVTPDTVAALSADGKNVTLKADGEATVTATVDKIKTDYKIKVARPDEVAVVGATDAQNVPVGTTVALTAEVKDNGAAIAELAAKVEWKSSDETLATVAGGSFTAVKEGEVTVTAKYGELSKDIKLVVVAAGAVAADAAGAPPAAPAK
jgi:hypothetical protein